MSSDYFSDPTSLKAAKQLRKRAEEDARLLSNRIALLKQEEMKALKKIEQTRKKARETLQTRSQYEEEARRQEEIKKQRHSEKLLKVERIKLFRDQKKQVRLFSSSYKLTQAGSEAQLIKKSREYNLRSIEVLKNKEIEQKRKIKELIKLQKQEAEKKRKKMIMEKKEAVRLELERKVEEEHKLRRKREQEILRMEQEELELIQRLQNTQLLQKSNDALENTLSGVILQ